MTPFIEGQPREQAVPLPDHLDEWIAEDDPVRAVDAFVEELNLQKIRVRERGAGSKAIPHRLGR